MTDINLLADYLPRAEVAKQLDRTERTLERWERQRTGPPITRVGKEPYYFIPSLKEWLRSCEQKMVRERGKAA